MKIEITKGFIIGLILGLMMSCSDNIMADGSGYEELGSTQYNPVYVKIVE
jgi:hypothetical protein